LSGVDPLVSRLRAAGCVFAEDEARLVREAASGANLESLVRRRISGEPLEQVIGFVEFDGWRYLLSPGVFVPRQRSLLLVDTAVQLAARLNRPPVVVDLCCGSGALGLAVQRRCGGSLHAGDIDPVAVACARRNGVEDAAVGDLFGSLAVDLRGEVDLLLVNAPYVPSEGLAALPAEARAYEPVRALDGGPDGLAVQRRVLAGAADWLTPEGHLLTETSTGQAETLCDVAVETGFGATIVSDPDRGATVLVASPDGVRRGVNPLE
jgi:release factor glutamine methyltransferase